MCADEKSCDLGTSLDRQRVGVASMMIVMGLLADGELLVVETADDWFMGTVEVTTDGAIVRTGYVGRPTVLALEDIVRIAPAWEYQDEGDGD